MTMLKGIMFEVYQPKGVIKTYNTIINGKNFYYQPIDSDIKRCQEIRKLTSGQGEDYTTGCLLDYSYIKNHYRLIAVYLCKQKYLNADPEAIKQIKFVGQLKYIYGIMLMVHNPGLF